MRWLTKTPLAVVEAHRVMLPRLRAREALRQVNIGAVAAGTFDKRGRDRVIRQWERDAHGATERPGKVTPASPAVLAAMGIGVVIEPPHEAGA